MTVTSTNQKVTFNGDGSTTVFAYNYKIFAQTDLLVILRVTATGTETTQSLTTNYTVSGVGTASGGNVTMGTAPASGTTLTILRVQPNLQGLDLVPNDPFPAGNLEASLDKLTFMVQTHEEEIGRSIKASKANTITTTDFTISATDRANKVFAFDSSGDLSVTQELGIFRGNWAASTAYAQRDLVKDTSTANIFIVNTAHTSSGSQPLTTNSNAAKYDLIVDAASATTSKTAAASSATASANSATASSNSAATSSTKADESAASAATSSTKAGEASTSATASANSATASANSATASANSATSAAASAADVAKVQGITNGTIAANKAVVVDANKDASSFRNLTASGAVTAGSLVIGSADIAEAELEMLDGITAGTAAASKAMVLDSAKDITGGRNLTISGELNAATLDISGDIDVDGTANLDIVDIDGAVDMASTLTVAGIVTANAGVVVDNITIDGTEIDLSSGDLTLDVAGDIILDAGGSDILLKVANTTFGSLRENASNFRIKSDVSDKDMLFLGNDGGAEITALTFDMAEGGAASFSRIFKLGADATNAPYFNQANMNTLNAAYGLDNDSADMWINYVGYQGGTSRFRDFRIGDGKTAVVVYVDGSSGNVSFNGNIIIGTDGKGIDFAAANTGASTNSILDSYEEGTYVPTITTQNGTVALNGSYNTLSYVKVGAQVTIQGRFRLGTCSSASGFVTMTVPFQNKNGTEESDYANLSLVTYNVDYTGGTIPFSEVSPNNSFSTWLQQADNAGWSTINASGLSDGDIIYVTGTYFTAS